MDALNCPNCLLIGNLNKVVFRGNFYVCENLKCHFIEDEESIKLLRESNVDKDKISPIDVHLKECPDCARLGVIKSTVKRGNYYFCEDWNCFFQEEIMENKHISSINEINLIEDKNDPILINVKKIRRIDSEKTCLEIHYNKESNKILNLIDNLNQNSLDLKNQSMITKDVEKCDSQNEDILIKNISEYFDDSINETKSNIATLSPEHHTLEYSQLGDVIDSSNNNYINVMDCSLQTAENEVSANDVYNSSNIILSDTIIMDSSLDTVENSEENVNDLFDPFEQSCISYSLTYKERFQSNIIDSSNKDSVTIMDCSLQTAENKVSTNDSSNIMLSDTTIMDSSLHTVENSEENVNDLVDSFEQSCTSYSLTYKERFQSNIIDSSYKDSITIMDCSLQTAENEVSANDSSNIILSDTTIIDSSLQNVENYEKIINDLFDSFQQSCTSYSLAYEENFQSNSSPIMTNGCVDEPLNNDQNIDNTFLNNLEISNKDNIISNGRNKPDVGYCSPISYDNNVVEVSDPTNLLNPIDNLNNILNMHTNKAINWVKLPSGLKAHNVILCALIIHTGIFDNDLDVFKKIKSEYKLCESFGNNFEIEKVKEFSFNFISKLYETINEVPPQNLAMKNMDEKMFISINKHLTNVDSLRTQTVKYNDIQTCSKCRYYEDNERDDFIIQLEQNKQFFKISDNQLRYTIICHRCKGKSTKIIKIKSVPNTIMIKCSDGISEDMELRTDKTSFLVDGNSLDLVGVVECSDTYPYIDCREERMTLDSYKFRLSNHLTKQNFSIHYRDYRGWYSLDQHKDITCSPSHQLIIKNHRHVKFLIFGIVGSRKDIINLSANEYLQKLALISESPSFFNVKDILPYGISNDSSMINTKCNNFIPIITKKRLLEQDIQDIKINFENSPFKKLKRSHHKSVKNAMEIHPVLKRLRTKVDLDDDNVSLTEDMSITDYTAVTSSGVSSSSSTCNEHTSLHSRLTASNCSGSTTEDNISMKTFPLRMLKEPCYNIDKLINLYELKFKDSQNKFKSFEAENNNNIYADFVKSNELSCLDSPKKYTFLK